MKNKYLKDNNKVRGSVLIEAVFTIPILLLFVFATLELGRQMAQISWVTQTAYEAIMLGNNIQPLTRELRMRHLSSVFKTHMNQGLQEINFSVPKSDELREQRLIEVNMSGILKAVTGLFGTPGIRMVLVGPDVLGMGFTPETTDFSYLGNFNCQAEPGVADSEPCQGHPQA